MFGRLVRWWRLHEYRGLELDVPARYLAALHEPRWLPLSGGPDEAGAGAPAGTGVLAEFGAAASADGGRVGRAARVDLVTGKPVRLRLLVGGEHETVQQLRFDSQAWLGRWNAQLPPEWAWQAPTMSQFIAECDQDLLDGRSYAFGLYVGDRLAGEVSLFDVNFKAVRSCGCGYWVAPQFAGWGLMPLALARVIEFAFADLNLHRVEVNIRPENAASLRVVEKLGLRREGVRKRYLFSDGRWTDHVSFAVTAEDVADDPLMERLL